MADMGELAKSLDASDMLGHLRNFPRDLALAWDRATSWDLSRFEGKQYSGVICLGMGGSATAGDFLACLAELQGCLPLIAHRGYDLPAWASVKWLGLAT